MHKTSSRVIGGTCLACVLLLINFLAATPAHARQPAAKLLPENTAVFVRVADVQDLKESFLKTSYGRLAQDPQVAPLIRQLYGSGVDALATLEEQLGTKITDALSIFQGEIAAAVIPQEGGPPAFVLLLDVGNQLPAAQKLLDRGIEFAEKNGADKSEENIDGLKFTTVVTRRRPQPFTYFVKDTTIVIGTNKEALKALLVRWDGGKGPSLASNAQYSAIMRHCEADKDHSAQLAWYADPITLVRSLGQGNATAQIGLAVLPILGLDGFKGIGGSIILANGEFDSILHVHVLLDNPRAGAIELLALGQGDTTPERWVAGDVQSYSTWYWDVNKTYTKLTTLVESLQGEGSFNNMVKSTVSDRIGVDLETDILPALDGRFTHITWIEKPATTMTAQGSLFGLKLKKDGDFQEVLDKIAAKFPERLEKKIFSGVTYYAFKVEGRDVPPDQLPTPCAAIVDNYLMISDRVKLLEKVIRDKDDGSNTLAKALDFKLISSKITRRLGEGKPGMLSFNRPEEGLRMWYDLATNEKNRDRLKSQGENNPFFKVLSDSLEQNPLPPFAVIAKYLAPGGGMVTNDDNGFHWTSFTLRRD